MIAIIGVLAAILLPAIGSAREAGGVNCTFVDSSIRFITAQVDRGDLSQPAHKGSDRRNSPYSVWGSMGTIAADKSMLFNNSISGFQLRRVYASKVSGTLPVYP